MNECNECIRTTSKVIKPMHVDFNSRLFTGILAGVIFVHCMVSHRHSTSYRGMLLILVVFAVCVSFSDIFRRKQVDSHNELRLYDDFFEVYVQYSYKEDDLCLDGLHGYLCTMRYEDVCSVDINEKVGEVVFVGYGRLAVLCVDENFGDELYNMHVERVRVPYGKSSDFMARLTLSQVFEDKIKYVE